jgi:GDP-4-dehydro-6-deoxy-D-mannose reductase
MTEIAGVAVRIELDQERVRPTEQRRVCGDPSKIRLAAGWTPSVPIDDSLRAVLNYWEGAIQHG